MCSPLYLESNSPPISLEMLAYCRCFALLPLLEVLCLLGVSLGLPYKCRTEKNDRPHHYDEFFRSRTLKRSLLREVSEIGPELAIVVMTCVLCAWNCKRKRSELQRKRVVPVVPIESVRLCDQDSVFYTVTHEATSNYALSESNIECNSISTSCTSFESLKNLEEMKRDTLLAYMI